jgi:WD40 repeat protein
LSGYPDGMFRPDAPIQRVDVMVALMGGLPRSTARPSDEVLSKSLQDWGYIPQYARMPLATAIVHQFLVSYPHSNLLRPGDAASRADVAALICQAQSLEKNQPSPVPEKYLTQMLTTPAPLPGGIQLSRVFYNLPPQSYPQDVANLALNSLGSFAVSEDGNTIAINGSGWGEATPRLILLNANTGSLQWSQNLPEKGDFPVFLRNNHVIVGTAKGVEVWDMATQKRKYFFDTPPSNSKAMALSPDGNYLTVHHGNNISVWQWQSGRRVSNITVGSPNGALTVVMAANQEGQPLVAAPINQNVQIWNGITGQLLQTIPSKFQDPPIVSIGISLDARWLTIGSFNQGAELWDLSTNSQVRTFSTNSYPQVMTFSPDSRYLAVGYEAQYHGTAGEGWRTIDSLQLWEIPGNGRLIGAWRGHGDVVRSISFSRDGRTLYSGSGEGVVKAWNIPNPLIENPTP